ncbi:hypothetical protein Mal64_37020 [Pseudobythopirellula maris]|uniref:Plasmid stabilization system protein n=1 Tax=Pseudobythopirellula maris TaxID=2527991 RepID=A0A5C5ZHN5_9BACT|nr:type II toxin-antitoxin system RelE/ParE family toxin [Pseudobythopirellula maris]TWT86872.1 hypothetical protein Mal64_37020 [Pseudobythopirellula maris]
MGLQLRILPRAEHDAQAINDYLYQRTAEGAQRWWLAFEAAVALAAELPQACGLAPEGEATPFEVRQFLFKTRRGRTYRGLFVTVGDELRVLRVRGPGQPPLSEDELA